MTVKMGFEKTKSRPGQSYGKSGWFLGPTGQRYWCSSIAEKMWLEQVTPGIESGDVKELIWQPDPLPLTFKYCRQECTDLYRPDARIIWENGDDWWIEIKRGRMEQKAANRLKRACQQHTDKAFVLVWFGSWPQKGVARRRLDHIVPLLHHVWKIK